MTAIRPLDAPFGAEVVGLEAQVPLDDGTTALLRDAFDRHHLLVLRRPDLPFATQEYLSKLVIHQEDQLDEHPLDNWYISNEREGAAAPHGRLQFHADGMWAERPFEVLSLYGEVVARPAVPTRFVSAHDVLRRLPAGLRARIEGRHARHTAGEVRRGDLTGVLVATVERAPSTVKPLVLDHPRTGEPLLWACEQMTQEIVGLDPDAGEALLGELFEHLYDPAFHVEHHWRQGDLVVWDNVALQHARPDVAAGGPPRTLRKVGHPRPSLGRDQMPVYGGTG